MMRLTVNNALCYRVPEVCALARQGRTSVYEAINSGKLVAHKRGRCTIIFPTDLQRYIEALPQLEVKHPVERGAVSETSSPNAGATNRKDGDGGGRKEASARKRGGVS
jgi:Helix-turn-helix domain